MESSSLNWGTSGSVDTGWLTVASQSTGLPTTLVEHPPGASIENMTFEMGSMAPRVSVLKTRY